MKVTVVHNEGAGHNDLGRAELTRWIETAGHTATFCAVEDVDVFNAALRDPGNLVAVAGGDGSVRSVGQALLHRDVPLTILPMGTANNVATHLGLTGDIEELIQQWDRSRVVPFDVGRIVGPWGDNVFFEGCGFGALARTMAALTPIEAPPSDDGTPHHELARDIAVTREMLADYSPHQCDVIVDGETLSGTFTIAEVLNIRSVGARIELAPDADSSDGLFEIVLIDDVGRRHLREYLTARLEGDDAVRLALPMHRGREIRIRWTGSRIHIDDELFPDEEAAASGLHWTGDGGIAITISVIPGALRFLVPGERT